MKINLGFVLFGVCTLVMGMSVTPQISLERTGIAFRKEENILGLKATKEQLGEEKYKKVLDLLREYLNGLKNIPRTDFGDLSDIQKLEKALENKDIRHLIKLLKNFIVGVQQLQGTSGEIAAPAADAKPATNPEPAANAKPAADAKPAAIAIALPK